MEGLHHGGAFSLDNRLIVRGVDLDLAEPRLIDGAAQLVVTSRVQSIAVSDQVDSAREHRGVVGSGLGEVCLLLLYGCQLLAELLLLVTSDVVRDRTADCLLGPIETLTLDLANPLRKSALRLRCFYLIRLQIVREVSIDGVDGCFGPLCAFAAPQQEYLCRDGVGSQVRQVAGRALRMASEAAEVRVGAAVAFRFGIDQSAFAALAGQRSAEIVVMLLRALTSQAPRIENLLDLLKKLRPDERFMLALVLDAAPGDVADVVAIPQQRLQLAGADRTSGKLWGGRQGEPARFQGFSESSQAPVAAGVGLKRPAHVVRPFRVDFHRAVFAAVNDVTDIAVADGGTRRGAAILHLLMDAFDHLVGEIARVELSNRTHDAMQQGA